MSSSIQNTSHMRSSIQNTSHMSVIIQNTRSRSTRKALSTIQNELKEGGVTQDIGGRCLGISFIKLLMLSSRDVHAT